MSRQPKAKSRAPFPSKPPATVPRAPAKAAPVAETLLPPPPKPKPPTAKLPPIPRKSKPAAAKPRGGGKGAKITRYTFADILESRTPETGHTGLLPSDEEVIGLPMDGGWTGAIQVGRLSANAAHRVVVDMDPSVDPVLFWSGKKSHSEVAVLPLQRNEIVSESRIAHIVSRARNAAANGKPLQGHLFADLEKSLRESDRSKRIEFYTHEEEWKNKLICGDSLQVIESLLHYERLRGRVQMIYFDPPYGIKYDANFQQRVDSVRNDDNDRADDVLSIKAFRDTWSLGVHSYLSYLQHRLYLMRDLLADRGSVFVQISDKNLHLVRCLLDEVFGANNFVALIPFRKKTMPLGTTLIEQMADFIIWYARDKDNVKFNKLYVKQNIEGEFHHCWYELPDGSRHRMSPEQVDNHKLLPAKARVYRLKSLEPSGPMASGMADYEFEGKNYPHPKNGYGTRVPEGMDRLRDLRRLQPEGNRLTFILYADESALTRLTIPWNDTVGADDKQFVVQTNSKVVERCMLMTTDPGDLVFDPTCGSGTTAYISEAWGRRWITCDTSRVAINVARKRLLSATFKHYRLAGAEISQGFDYSRASKTTLGSLANGEEPEELILVNSPVVDNDAIRITGPFDVGSLGRYSPEDWKGFFIADDGMESAKLENYIGVICRLYRKDAAVQGASGFVHAIVDSESSKIALSVGPLSGRVTAKQIQDAVEDAASAGLQEVHILGWAFEPNVGEIKAQFERQGKATVELVMIRPDTLEEGLKISRPETLFSPLALPDVEFKNVGVGSQIRVILKGVALFDRSTRTTSYKSAESRYVSAWYLDEDYDGDCFVDCQMFFDFRKIPNLNAMLDVVVDPGEYRLGVVSEPFEPGEYRRFAVRIVDVFGNESTIVRDIA